MPTSGTIGATVISTGKLIEHAIRRCGISPADQNSETLDIALDNLYLIVMAILNDGINLWLVDHYTIGINENQSQYTLPSGTVDLLNVQYSTTSFVTGTDTSNATSFTTELASTTSLQAIGVEFSAITASSTVYLEYSSDGNQWTEILSSARTDWVAGKKYWFRFTHIPSGLFFRVRNSANITVSNFILASLVSDLPIYPYNRDDWLAQSNKSVISRQSTNYYFEKILNPRITLWPIPSVDTDFISVTVQRKIQDVGALGQELELPDRWKELIIWQLASRLSFELPGITAERRGEIQSQVVYHTSLVNGGETDGTTIRLMPAIGVYTR